MYDNGIVIMFKKECSAYITRNEKKVWKKWSLTVYSQNSDDIIYKCLKNTQKTKSLL